MYRPLNNSASARPLLDVETTIRGLTQDFCTSFNTGNYDQAAALFSSDATFMISHREPAQGTKAIERALRQYGDVGYENLLQETMRVDFSGDMAIEIGRYTVSIHSPKQGNVLDRGNFVRAWRRVGSWFIAAESWNSQLPAFERETPSNTAKVA
jgi:uncharacterized protein (TIGR02246 family)